MKPYQTKHRTRSGINAIAALALIAGGTTAVAAPKPPNIVLILADDLGWSDVGFNGTKFYETPNLDRISKAGMVLNRAYSGGPNCLPMRACLLSGMYTPRTQIWTPGGKSKGNVRFMKLKVPVHGQNWDTIPSKLALAPSVTSIAEVLKSAGYKTARFGKWHVGPDAQGFDISDSNGKGAPMGKNFYGDINVHESLTDASVQFIADNKDQPFFLYLCHWDVHTPIRAKEENVARFREKLKNGKWDRPWNPTYAAMIQAVDESVMRVHAKLVELGLENDTLFIFSSDNGGVSEVTTNLPLHGGKGSLFEGGVRVPTFVSWPGVVQAGASCDTPVTSVDFMPTFAELAGAKLPANQPVDGTSLVPLLNNKPLAERSIFWHFPLYLSATGADSVVPVSGTDKMLWRGVPSSMIMRGDWKLIHYFEDDSFKLYNPVKDISESKDLAASHPEIAAALTAELKAWQTETRAVIPKTLNASFDPTAIPPDKQPVKKEKE